MNVFDAQVVEEVCEDALVEEKRERLALEHGVAFFLRGWRPDLGNGGQHRDKHRSGVTGNSTYRIGLDY